VYLSYTSNKNKYNSIKLKLKTILVEVVQFVDLNYSYLVLLIMLNLEFPWIYHEIMMIAWQLKKKNELINNETKKIYN